MMRKCFSTAVCCFIFLGGAQASEMTKDGEPFSFLTRGQLPDSLSILPSPPRNDSVAFLLDKAAYEQGRSQAGSDRWLQAINDANLSDENIGKPFSQALGVDISEEKTPATYTLLKKNSYRCWAICNGFGKAILHAAKTVHVFQYAYLHAPG